MTLDRLGIVGNAQHATATTRRDARPSVSLVVARSLYPCRKVVLNRETVLTDILPAFSNKDSKRQFDVEAQFPLSLPPLSTGYCWPLYEI